MTYIEHDRSFFEELEATAKRLSTASPADRSTSGLKQLFDELKERMAEADSVHARSERADSALSA
jgi:hypothetical protein